jgi:hypothetical protein
VLASAATVPGLLAAKFVGASWPVAGAAGILCAPVIILLVVLHTQEPA